MRESSEDTNQNFPSQPQFALSVIKQRLNTLHHNILKDTTYLPNLSRTPAITLHKATSSGGKFWTGAIVANGLHLHWGKLRTRGTMKLITAWTHNSPALDLMHRACQKVLNGYTIHSPDTFLPK